MKRRENVLAFVSFSLELLDAMATMKGTSFENELF